MLSYTGHPWTGLKLENFVSLPLQGEYSENNFSSSSYVTPCIPIVQCCYLNCEPGSPLECRRGFVQLSDRHLDLSSQVDLINQKYCSKVDISGHPSSV